MPSDQSLRQSAIRCAHGSLSCRSRVCKGEALKTLSTAGKAREGAQRWRLRELTLLRSGVRPSGMHPAAGQAQHSRAHLQALQAGRLHKAGGAGCVGARVAFQAVRQVQLPQRGQAPQGDHLLRSVSVALRTRSHSATGRFSAFKGGSVQREARRCRSRMPLACADEQHQAGN